MFAAWRRVLVCQLLSQSHSSSSMHVDTVTRRRRAADVGDEDPNEEDGRFEATLIVVAADGLGWHLQGSQGIAASEQQFGVKGQGGPSGRSSDKDQNFQQVVFGGFGCYT